MANFHRACLIAMIFLFWSEAAAALSFVTLADIHFDPLVDCYRESHKPCELLQALRQAPVKNWRQILLASNHNPRIRQDTNLLLLQESLADAKAAAKAQNAAFVIVLGDSLPHDFRRHYKKYSLDSSRQGFHQFALKTLAFISNELQAAFPDTSVFMVVGNNDTYSGNYQSLPGGEFFAKAAVDWSTLVKNNAARTAMQHQFPQAGYYAVDVPEDNQLRLVVLNSVLFSTRSRNNEALLAGQAELSWLQQELKQARKRQQKVLIALHIPPMVDVYLLHRWRLFTMKDFWREDFLKQFKQILLPYHSDIVGIVTGHLHYGWSQWLPLTNEQEVSLVSIPSISPIFGNEPSFRVYELSSEAGLVEKEAYQVSMKIQGRLSGLE